MNNRKQNIHHDFQPLKQLQQSLTTLQNHCSGFFQSTISNLQKHAISLNPPVSTRNTVWARIDLKNEFQSKSRLVQQSGAALSNEVIEERLAGVPVYALTNATDEFVLVSGVSTGKSLGLFCFEKDDAEALLQHMQSMEPGMRSGSKVVPVALNKIFQLKVDGVAFRLIPQASQVKNALRERVKAGVADDAFSGVPVFQSRSLLLKNQNKSYRPVFFRKEDLENSLLRASRDQNQLNPAFRQGDIQVAVLEDIIKGMKESSISKWDDVVFIPPGFDVSTNPPMQ